MTVTVAVARFLLAATVMISVVVVAGPAHAQQNGDESADQAPTKAFGSFHLGFGYFNMSATSGQTSAAFSGPLLDAAFTGGGRISRRLGLFAEGAIFGSPRMWYAENGTGRDIGATTWLGSRISGGVVCWIRPANVYIAGAASLAWYSVREAATNVALVESAFGPAAFVEAGRHWRSRYGLDTAIRVFYGAARQLDRDFRWRTYIVALVIGPGYSPFWSGPPAPSDGGPGSVQ